MCEKKILVLLYRLLRLLSTAKSVSLEYIVGKLTAASLSGYGIVDGARRSVAMLRTPPRESRETREKEERRDDAEADDALTARLGAPDSSRAGWERKRIRDRKGWIEKGENERETETERGWTWMQPWSSISPNCTDTLSPCQNLSTHALVREHPRCILVLGWSRLVRVQDRDTLSTTATVMTRE